MIYRHLYYSYIKGITGVIPRPARFISFGFILCNRAFVVHNVTKIEQIDGLC